MNSEQEKIAAELSAKSLGAPFLITPEAHRAGKTDTTPCDLVWICNGGVLLFSFAESGRSREKMARHNFNSLKNAYREWQRGRSLKGKNRYSSFDIPFDQYPHKILVSVVKGPEAASEWNGDIGDDLAAQGCPRPTLCATISQNVLEYIAAHGGSVIDLLLFLNGLCAPDNEPILPAPLSLRAIRRQHNASHNVALPGQVVDFRSDPRLYALDPVLQTLRSGAAQNGLVPFLLGDLSWPHVLQLVHHIKQLERKTALLPPGILGVRAAGTLLDLPPYLLGLIVRRSGDAGDAADEQDALLLREIRQHKEHQERFSVLFRYSIGDGARRSVSALAVPSLDDLAPALQSQSAALLDTIRARTAPP